MTYMYILLLIKIYMVFSLSIYFITLFLLLILILFFSYELKTLVYKDFLPIDLTFSYWTQTKIIGINASLEVLIPSVEININFM